MAALPRWPGYLDISQPAVSAQVQALESELGVQLLERLPRQVRLTPAGELLRDYARRLLNLEAEAQRALRGSARLAEHPPCAWEPAPRSAPTCCPRCWPSSSASAPNYA